MRIQSSSALEKNPPRRKSLVLSGTMLLSFVLGSVHSFSVLLPALEETFSASRTSASLTYSLALVALATAVFLGHRLYSKVSPGKFVAGVGVMAAIGCVLAGLSESLPMVWLGYSLLFGAANGLGYGYSLQFSAQAMPERKGFAMGAVTAAYALGAVVFPLPLSIALDAGGWSGALTLLASSLLLLSSLSAVLLGMARMRYRSGADENSPAAAVRWQTVVALWFAYGFAVTAGLMAIGHATGLAKVAGADQQWMVAAPIIIAASNMIGSLFCGVLHDKLADRTILSALMLLTSGALFTIAVFPHTAITLAGLMLIGFTYGGTIAVYPAFIARQFGAARGTIIYGKVFTAWAAAGLVGPGMAGVLFDLKQNYVAALATAAGAALLSFLIVNLSVTYSNITPGRR